MDRKKTLKYVAPVVGLMLFGAAAWVMYGQLEEHDLGETWEYFQSLSLHWVLVAAGLTALSYTVLVGNDLLALRYVGHTLPLHKTAMASFIAYSFSRSIGYALLTGGASRFRLYATWGLSNEEITKASVFCALEVWIGFATIGGVAFLIATPEGTAALDLPVPTFTLGLAALLLLGVYLAWSAIGKGTVKIGDWRIPPPRPRIAAGQVLVSSADMLITAGVLYSLLPDSDEMTYLYFLSVFPLAIIAGAISQVPSGLGVFDTVILLLVGPYVPVTGLLGALVIYRVIYYLAPLILAASLLAVKEVREQRKD